MAHVLIVEANSERAALYEDNVRHRDSQATVYKVPDLTEAKLLLGNNKDITRVCLQGAMVDRDTALFVMRNPPQ